MFVIVSGQRSVVSRNRLVIKFGHRENVLRQLRLTAVF